MRRTSDAAHTPGKSIENAINKLGTPDAAVSLGEDHGFLDSLDEAHARIFAAEQGYDLIDDQGMLTDWWGFCWMILAEKRGLLTAENRAAARFSGVNRPRFSARIIQQ